jgi:aryl-alcohol dehydrogenase-like predicted oxidoreductase
MSCKVVRTGRVQQVQVPYNARDRLVEREILPAAAELGLGVLVMQPLGEGALARRSPSAAALAPLARYGVATWAQALLKWIVSEPRVHCAIPATTKVERMRENAAAGDPPWLDEAGRAYVAELAAAAR